MSKDPKDLVMAPGVICKNCELDDGTPRGPAISKLNDVAEFGTGPSAGIIVAIVMAVLVMCGIFVLVLVKI